MRLVKGKTDNKKIDRPGERRAVFALALLFALSALQIFYARRRGLLRALSAVDFGQGTGCFFMRLLLR